MHKRFKAFTIIELLIVITVIAILSVLSIVAYLNLTTKASQASIQSDLTNNSKKLKLYYAQYGSYPTTLDTNLCPSSPTADTTGGYCLKLSSGNSINNYTGSNLNYTLGISQSSNSTNCYQITSTTNPTNLCSSQNGYSAEQLLSQATWWIDAAYSTNGQTISNLGTGGSALNATNGSTQNTDTNDALYLDYTGTPYVYLPGVAGNNMTVPDEASFAPPANSVLTVDVECAMDNYTAGQRLISQWASQTYSRAWTLQTFGTNSLRLFWVDSSGVAQAATATANYPIPIGQRAWFRFVLNTNNGGNWTVNFYTSPAGDGVNWTQIGNQITGTGSTTIQDPTTPVVVGDSYDQVGSSTGKFYHARVNINGTTVLDADPSVLTSGTATTFAAKTGQTITINRSTSGRKSVAVVSSPVWLLGTDDYMQVADNDLLDFGSGEAFSVVAVYRVWDVVLGNILAKKASTATSDSGYSLGHSAGNLDMALADGSLYTAPGITPTAGALTNFGFTEIDASSRYTFKNGVQSVLYSKTMGSFINSEVLRVGRLTGAVSADAEIIAAAVFRRALTPAEITTISNYYTNRVK